MLFGAFDVAIPFGNIYAWGAVTLLVIIVVIAAVVGLIKFIVYRTKDRELTKAEKTLKESQKEENEG